MDWMKLKSGSDVRGVAVGENAPLTEHVAMCLAWRSRAMWRSMSASR